MNSYTDITGVLVFDGAPVVTRIVKLFFEPFHLTELWQEDSHLDPHAMYLQQCDEEDISTWDALMLDVLTLCQELIYGPDQYCPPDDIDIASLILDLGKHHRADLDALQEVLEDIDFDNGPLDLADACDIVRLIRDGHNVKAIRLMGGYHADRNRLWHFGGFMQYADAKVSLGIGTYRLIEASRKIERGEVEEGFGDLVQTLLDSVQDKDLKIQVAQRVASLASRVVSAAV